MDRVTLGVSRRETEEGQGCCRAGCIKLISQVKPESVIHRLVTMVTMVTMIYL